MENPILFIDMSYYIFYRFFALSNWYKRSQEDILDVENILDNKIFMEKYHKLFIENIKKIQKKYNIQDSLVIFARDCRRYDIWRNEHYEQYKQNRDDKNEMSLIFSKVFFSKLLLLLFSILIFLSIILSVSMLKDNYIVYLFSFMIVINNLIYPQWFFQGIEKMEFITILNVIIQVIYLVCIFSFYVFTLNQSIGKFITPYIFRFMTNLHEIIEIIWISKYLTTC